MEHGKQQRVVQDKQQRVVHGKQLGLLKLKKRE